MKQQTARELLFLERTSQIRELTDDETSRWHELATLLFSHADKTGPKRKATRLSINTKATVDINGKLFNCSVTELSQVNLTLGYEDFEEVNLGDHLSLKTIMVNGAYVNLNLRCKIMRIRADVAGKPAAGVEIVADAPKEAIHKFFHSVYYPLYIKYVENLAAGEP